ncbi:patatin-like phospholipase domain-containing protein [Hirsutella rhossiliensis]
MNDENGSLKYACLAAGVHYRILFPFSDVVCLFTDDLGGIADAVQQISRWIDKGQPSTPYILPHILLVTEKELGVHEYTEFQDLLRSQNSMDPYNRCKKIRLVENLKNFAIPVLASSFILDQYVPRMHAFKPQLIFAALYRQTCISAAIPVQNHFEVAYGTSSGAISVCGLFINGWPIEDCIASSEAIAKLAFRPRILLSLAYDCRYPARGLEKALQQLFGTKRGILDQSAATEMGQFVGMPVTATGDASTYIVTNYNGVGNSDERAGYRNIQPAAGISGVPLWKFLRGSTAAPFYFSPQLIEGFGNVQDGGLAYNNPTSMAYEESKRLFLILGPA